jgi:hypothetical protein
LNCWHDNDMSAATHMSKFMGTLRALAQLRPEEPTPAWTHASTSNAPASVPAEHICPFVHRTRTSFAHEAGALGLLPGTYAGHFVV